MEIKDIINALGALAQETRLRIFRLLVEAGPQGLAVGAIAERLGVPNATLSFHLKELSLAGLIVGRQSGRFIWYSANIAAINDLVAYLAQNCCVKSVVCDPGCAPLAASCSPLQIELQATSITRIPRKRGRA